MTDLLSDDVEKALIEAGRDDLVASIQKRRARDAGDPLSPEAKLDALMTTKARNRRGEPIIAYGDLVDLSTRQLAQIRSRDRVLYERSLSAMLDTPETWTSSDTHQVAE